MRYALSGGLPTADGESGSSPIRYEQYALVDDSL